MKPQGEPPFRMTDQELKRLTDFVAILIKIDRRLKKAKGAKKKRKSSYTAAGRFCVIASHWGYSYCIEAASARLPTNHFMLYANASILRPLMHSAYQYYICALCVDC